MREIILRSTVDSSLSAPDARPFTGRLLAAGAFVALWCALGFALHLDANAYLVLGVPLGIAFQHFIARAPLRAAWVTDAPPLRFDTWTCVLAAVLAVAPLLAMKDAIHARSLSVGAWAVAGAAGAFGAAYAIRSARTRSLPRLVLASGIAALPGLVIMVLAVVVQHAAQHRAFPGWRVATGRAALSFAQYLPISFALEEVVFRGVLGAHVLRGAHGKADARRGVILVSALWGVWHLPIVHAPPGLLALFTTAGSLIGVHVLVGVGLFAGYRRSGTLLVPAVAHALIDAIRNGWL
jgi:hypothetical protein